VESSFGVEYATDLGFQVLRDESKLN